MEQALLYQQRDPTVTALIGDVVDCGGGDQVEQIVSDCDDSGWVAVLHCAVLSDHFRRYGPSGG